MLSLNDEKWHLIQHAASVRRTLDAVEYIRRFGVEPVLIKGVAVGSYYDNPIERKSSDVDLVISAKDFSLVGKILDKDEIRHRQIDLHIGLRRLDLMPFESFIQNSRITKIQDVRITVPSPEDHLRIVCAHWLLDGGLYFEKLWDIFYLVKNRPRKFNWNLCLGNDISASWVKFSIGVAAKYLSLKLDEVPFREEIEKGGLISPAFSKMLEKKWQNPQRLVELSAIRQQRMLFWRQVLLRFQPDPFKAAVNTSTKLERNINYMVIGKDLWQRFILYRQLAK